MLIAVNRPLVFAMVQIATIRAVPLVNQDSITQISRTKELTFTHHRRKQVFMYMFTKSLVLIPRLLCTPRNEAIS